MTDAILQVIFRTLTLEVIKPAKISRYPCAPSIRIFVAFLGGGGRSSGLSSVYRSVGMQTVLIPDTPCNQKGHDIILAVSY